MYEKYLFSLKKPPSLKVVIELDEGLKTSDSGTFPAFLKYAMNLLKRPGGFLRRPILELTDEQKSNVSNLLKKLKIL